jgi:transketolase
MTLELARKIRLHALRMTHKAKASHIGSCFSIADVLAVLYEGVLRVAPETADAPDRDRLVFSKGHAAAVLYAVLAERGFFPRAWLHDYCEDGSELAGHVRHHVPGVEVSTGSLGHGLSIGCGMALAARADQRASRVFVILSDGECDEGSVWEAALFAPCHRLANLCVVVDYNKIQSLGSVEEVLDLEPLAAKWRAFGWAVEELDGHDHGALAAAFARLPLAPERPSAIIAHTVKGKGVPFMEHQLAWHYRSVDERLLAEAIAALEAAP